jgi:hypothetical protein
LLLNIFGFKREYPLPLENSTLPSAESGEVQTLKAELAELKSALDASKDEGKKLAN